MKLETIKKESKRNKTAATSCRLYQEDYDFIKKNNINVSKLISEALKELKAK